MAVGRCPYPHARIDAIDVTAALARSAGAPGPRRGGGRRRAPSPIGILRPIPGAPAIPHFALAETSATYEGQPVVSVAATTRHVAEDALDLIEIDYEPLPHVSDVDRRWRPEPR